LQGVKNGCILTGMDTKETMLAWAAGMLDADGTLTIKRQMRSGKWCYVMLMQLSQINTEKGKKNTARLKEVLGGCVNKAIVKKGGTNLVSKEILVWQATSKRASACIEKIEKYMAGKQRQASLLREFYEECFEKRTSGYRLTEEDSVKRKEYFERMRELQEKGFNPSNND
jgi:hypothetical protein